MLKLSLKFPSKNSKYNEIQILWISCLLTLSTWTRRSQDLSNFKQPIVSAFCWLSFVVQNFFTVSRGIAHRTIVLSYHTIYLP